MTALDYVKCPFERAKMVAAGIGDNLDPAAALARDKARYAAWEARGKPPSPSTPPRVRYRPKAKLRVANERPILERIVAAQNGLCGHCGEPMLLDCPVTDPKRATFDHVRPKARGGIDSKNRIAMHLDCNNRKSDRLPNGCERLMLEVVNIVVPT